MNKIIVERPRRGSWQKSRKTARRLSPTERARAIHATEDYDSGPDRASSARHSKWLNENLAPLRRYLTKQVGRPWTKVYAEIRKNIDTRSAIGLHVMQHLFDFIAVNVEMEGGVLYEMGRFGRHPVRGLYVHPRTGIIRAAKPRKAAPKRPERTLIAVSETVEYEKIDGLWFRMLYRLRDADELVPGWDGTLVRAIELGLRSTRELIHKQQCDRKTIRRLEREAQH